MNSITFDGRLAADSEMRYTSGGKSVLSFRVASDIGFGEKKVTNWFQCQIWGARAEALQQYLIKGQQVTVYGQLTLRERQDKEGVKRLSPDVNVNEISLQGSRQDNGNSGNSRQQNRQSNNASGGYAKASGSGGQRQRGGSFEDMNDDIPY